MGEQDALSRQRRLIAGVADSLGSSCVCHETHISVVLVSGGFAWKFKKAVRFDFLDFSTLDKRLFYCQEELRLNRRYAPGIYFDVVAVTGTLDHPTLGGEGVPLEYAVKMRAFDQAALWSERVALGRLAAADIDAWATRLATMHSEAQRSPADSPWCTPTALQAIANETLDLVTSMLPEATHLRVWEDRMRAALHDSFLERKSGGYIRECHGDLHCANIIATEGGAEAFDCIEFNDSMRWIDVMNDIAFTCMDLRFRGIGNLASRLLNVYLEHTGDYGGLRQFAYYEVHRALIRCKVALLSAQQGAAQGRDEARAYLAVASERSNRPRPMIVITHGFSGSGKSTLARAAVEMIDGIQLRSDVERKRMHGVPALQRGDSDLYTADATAAVYRRLLDLAQLVVQAGWTPVVDATFLAREQRALFAALADELDVRFVILSAQADADEMRRRIEARARSHNDPSDAGLDVLDRQLVEHDPFTSNESRHACLIDTSGDWHSVLHQHFSSLLESSAAASGFLDPDQVATAGRADGVGFRP